MFVIILCVTSTKILLTFNQVSFVKISSLIHPVADPASNNNIFYCGLMVHITDTGAQKVFSCTSAHITKTVSVYFVSVYF